MAKQRINKNVTQTIIKGEYTYKQLCEIGVFIDGAKTGNTKKAQITDLKQYLDMDTESKKGKIIVKGIYEEKKIKFMNSELISYIQMIIIDNLIKNEGNKMIATTKDLVNMCGMVNDKFDNSYNDISYSTNVDLGIVYDVMNGITSTNSRNIYRALNDLQNKGSILFRQQIFVIKKEYDIKHDMDIYISVEPNDYEYEQIIIYQNEVMELLKIDDMSSLFHGKNASSFSKYKKEINIRLKELGYESMFWAYKINYSSKVLEKVLSKRKYQDIKSQINKQVLERIFKSIDNKMIDIDKEIDNIIKNTNEKDKVCLELYTDGETSNIVYKYISSKKKLRAKDNYNDDSKKVAKAVVDSKSRIVIKKRKI